jgi:hypothetical protein
MPPKPITVDRHDGLIVLPVAACARCGGAPLARKRNGLCSACYAADPTPVAIAATDADAATARKSTARNNYVHKGVETASMFRSFPVDVGTQRDVLAIYQSTMLDADEIGKLYAIPTGRVEAIIARGTIFPEKCDSYRCGGCGNIVAVTPCMICEVRDDNRRIGGEPRKRARS